MALRGAEGGAEKKVGYARAEGEGGRSRPLYVYLYVKKYIKRIRIRIRKGA